MSKLTLVLPAILLAGCASTGSWSELEIDASSQSSIDSSVLRIQQALPAYRRERFDMVLADLWITGTHDAEAKGAEYTQSDYFAQLDGLRYEDVLDLAGPATTPRYWAVVQSGGRRGAQDDNRRAWPGTDANRFPAANVVPPSFAAP